MSSDRICQGLNVLKLVLMSVVLLAGTSAADEPYNGVTTGMADRWNAVFDEISTSFQVNRHAMPLADLQKSTVLNLWNPNRVGAPRVGRIYLWTEQGCPVLIGGVFTETLGFREAVNVIYEFHSLDSKSLQVEQREILLDCPTAGIKWLPLEGIRSPQPSRVFRMVQMRDIARSFQVSGIHPRLGPVTYELLPNPIYRYEKETSMATDGAIFAIGASTDPSVFVLIEGRDNAWWVAFARSNVMAFKIERNNQPFYEFAKTTEKQRNTPFYIDWHGEIRSASSPETGGSSLK